MVLIFSDLFDEPKQVLQGLREIRSRGHDIVVFHIMDRDEVEFPFERMTLFQGIEELPELLCDPKSLRDAYLEGGRRLRRRRSARVAWRNASTTCASTTRTRSTSC